MMRTDASTDIQIRPTTGEVASLVRGGLAYFTDIERRLAPYFERAEPRRRTMPYLQGRFCRNIHIRPFERYDLPL